MFKIAAKASQPHSIRELPMTFAQAAYSFTAVMNCYNQMDPVLQAEFGARFLQQLEVHASRDVQIPRLDGVGVLKRHAYKRCSIAPSSISERYAEKPKHERLAILLTAAHAAICDKKRNSDVTACFEKAKDKFFANKDLCCAYDRSKVVKIVVQEKELSVAKLFKKSCPLDDMATIMSRFLGNDPFVEGIKQSAMPDVSELLDIAKSRLN